MKRDMELVRKLILDIENDAPPGEAKEYSTAETSIIIQEHLRLLANAGLIDDSWSTSDSQSALLTWEGHDFADALRDQEVWNQVKAKASTAGGFTVGLLVAMGKAYIKRRIESATGLELS